MAYPSWLQALAKKFFSGARPAPSRRRARSSPASNRRTRPSLECLEDRCCPAVSISLNATTHTLLISGTPNVVAGASSITVQESSAGYFQVQDGTGHPFSISYGPANNIQATISAAVPVSFTLDTKGAAVSGNVSVSLANSMGNTALFESTADGGSIGGTLSYTGGNGIDSVTIGNAANTFSVVGASTFSTAAGNDSLTVTNHATLAGVTATMVNSVAVNTGGTTGALTLNSATEALNDSVTIAGTTGALNLNTGPSNDTVSVTGATGDVTANLGNGTNSYTSSGTNSVNLVYVGGNGADTVSVTTAMTSVSVNLGAGGADSLTTSAAISGALTVTSGGNDTITVGGTAGSVSITTGSGTNNATINGNVSGAVSFTGGNGADTFTDNGTVGAGISVSPGNGGNTVLIAGAVTGNATITEGTGVNQVTINAGVTGSVNVTLGNAGSPLGNSFTLGTTGTFTVGGTLSITSLASGAQTIHLGTGSGVVTLSGTVTIDLHLSTGTINFIDNATQSGGNFNYTGSGGSDIVELGGSFTGGAGTQSLTIHLGAGNDTLDLDFTGSFPAAIGGVTLDGGSGTNTGETTFDFPAGLNPRVITNFQTFVVA